MLFGSLFSILAAGFLAISFRRRPSLAIGAVVPVVLALPVWIMLPLFDTPDGTMYGSGLDLKVAVGAFCLGVYCFLPNRALTFRLAPLDFLVVAMIAVHVASDCYATGFSWMVLARASVEWYLPYLLGRLACQHFDDIQWLARAAGCAAVMLGIVAATEALTGVNVFEAAMGGRPVEGFSRQASRWGMKRAYGPTMHPIYFGVVGILLFGWSQFQSVSALRKRAHPLWLFVPAAAVLLVCFTGSRGPILGLAIALAGGVFVYWRKSRIPLIIAGTAILGVLFTNREAILKHLDTWGAGKEIRTTELALGDEVIQHTGTRNRLSILSVYKVAVQRSGLLGFGTEAVSTFPVNVPVGPTELKTLKRTKYIDNTYLLLTLRFGYLGVAVFVFACIAAVAQLIFVADRHTGRSPGILAACIGGSLIGVYAVILTVWMPPDFGFLLVWTLGCSSGIFLAMGKSEQKPALPSSDTATDNN